LCIERYNFREGSVSKDIAEAREEQESIKNKVSRASRGTPEKLMLYKHEGRSL